MENLTHTIPSKGNIRRTNPKQFNLWLFIVSIIMIFAGLTSALIVKKTTGDWVDVSIPSSFMVNTALIVLSSLTMQWAYWSAKKDKINTSKIGLFLTLILGIGFLIGQYLSWGQMVQNDILLAGNASGSFIYVLTGAHAFHIAAGLVFLLIVFILAINSRIHAKNLLSIRMCTTFWHFLSILWLYLYVFLAFLY